MSTFTNLRQKADLELHREKMEYLAKTRSEIQMALEVIQTSSNPKDTGNEKGYFISTASDYINTGNRNRNDAIDFLRPSQSPSSLLFMTENETRLLLKSRLNKIETELVQVCQELQDKIDE
mmetsp:Transcript_6052/g.7697  ORF Transcript_6052/g.7697 Transcript_6052/m.7697 type:complete len:121 (+) Transcript_6052:42-404(+)